MFRAPLKQVFVYAFLASAAAFLPTHANAALVSIGWSEDGGAITTVAGSGVSDVFGASFATPNFTVLLATGATQPTLPFPVQLVSSNFSTSSLGGHSLDVWVTAQGLTDIGLLQGFNSNLTQNNLGGTTTTLQSLLDPGNGLFTGGVLSSANFVAPGGAVFDLAFANTGAGPYSVTGHYHINAADGALLSNAQISIAAVPGPIVGAGLPGLIAACLGLFGLNRRRKKLAA